MAHLPIQCQNCGAKYKIPETFKGDSAKCKACGTAIDIASARAKATAGDDPAPVKSASHTGGGTRRPRATSGSSSRSNGGKSSDSSSGSRSSRSSGTRSSSRRGAAEEEETSASSSGSRRRGSSRRSAAASVGKGSTSSSRRSRRDREAEDDFEEEEEGGGRPRYEKKKDNTPMILGAVIGGMAVLALIVFMVWNSGQKAAAERAATLQKEADAEAVIRLAAAAERAKAREEAESKEAESAKAEEASAKKSKKKPKKRKLSKKETYIKKEEDVKTAADVFQPSKCEALAKLDVPEGLSEADLKDIDDLVETMKEGGFQSSKAKNKLAKKGVMMIPVAVNKMLALDFTSADDNRLCADLGEAIRQITHFTLGWENPPYGDELDILMGHRNAERVWDAHQMARIYWHSEEKLAKYKKAYKIEDDR